jgi:hypothetical protein
VDKIAGLRWFENENVGVVFVPGLRIGITERKDFDLIEKAFIQFNYQSMYTDELKKISWYKRED